MATLFNPIHACSTPYSYLQVNDFMGNPEGITNRLLHHLDVINMNNDGTYNNLYPLSFAAKNDSNDTFYLHQAIKEPDADKFIEAMEKEINDHEHRRHWIKVRRHTAGSNCPIKAIWSFKRKRRPDGTIIKHKARLCAHGGMQIHGINYWETFSPVVNWTTVRLLMTIGLIEKLYTQSIDFTLAFPQAEVECEIFMELPPGFKIQGQDDYILKLVKNLYGLKNASKQWFNLIKDNLTNEKPDGLGFKQSDIDPCLFYRDGCVLLIYVDDCLIFVKEKSEATEIMNHLKELQFELTDEGPVSAYLGVDVQQIDDATFTLKQPFLVQRIIDSLGNATKDANVKSTPAVHRQLLTKDLDGPERKQNWNYRSLVGMLNYLALSTRPDIAFAVHQCAKFNANSKLSHEAAIKRIVCNLKGTSEEGITLKIDKSLGLECYVDADFAGGWSKESCHESSSLLSRTGYVIYYKGCILTWKSKMQTEIALSTTEAEYIALSQSMREVIPLLEMIHELRSIYLLSEDKPIIKCTLFEDNNGALALAKEPKYRPRTKHIALKYHHFREYVKRGLVNIEPIDTKLQIADIFTKPLEPNQFTFLRKKLCGW